MWWEGPSWLGLSAQDWLSLPELVDCPQPDEEKPSLPETTLVAVSVFSLPDRISSYSRLQRVTSWIFRLVTNSCVSLELQMKDHLSAKEFNDAEMFWVKMTQLVEFSTDISTLKDGKELAANYKILNLQPFIDQRGLLGVQGRLPCQSGNS